MKNCFCGMDEQQKVFSLFPVRTIVGGSYHCKPPIRRGQEWNLRRTLFQVLFIYYLFIYLLKLYLPLVHKIAFPNKFQLYHKIN